MSELEIVSHIADGLYNIIVVPNTVEASTRSAQLAAESAAILSTSLPASDAALSAATSEFSAAEAEQNFMISQYVLELATIEQVVAAHEGVTRAGLLLADARTARNILLARLAAIDLAVATITAQIALQTRTTTAWACDASFGLSGTSIGGIDIDGDCQASGEVLIRPNLVGSAIYAAGRDGRNTPAFSATPEALTYNWALRDGWQKWLPLYRIATITSIDYATSTCAITYLNSESLDQRVDINQTVDAVSVPIEYSTCGADAFRTGDQVIVYFQTRDWTAPKVIGFRRSPRKCGFRLRLNDGNSGNPITPSAGDKVRLYTPSPSFAFREEMLLSDLPFISSTSQHIVAPGGDYSSVLCEVVMMGRVRVAYPASYTTATLLSAATPISSGASVSMGVPSFSANIIGGVVGVSQTVVVSSSIPYTFRIAVYATPIVVADGIDAVCGHYLPEWFGAVPLRVTGVASGVTQDDAELTAFEDRAVVAAILADEQGLLPCGVVYTVAESATDTLPEGVRYYSIAHWSDFSGTIVSLIAPRLFTVTSINQSFQVVT